jgi:hypothetical protein
MALRPLSLAEMVSRLQAQGCTSRAGLIPAKRGFLPAADDYP